jgi:hypothetical protein
VSPNQAIEKALDSPGFLEEARPFPFRHRSDLSQETDALRCLHRRPEGDPKVVTPLRCGPPSIAFDEVEADREARTPQLIEDRTKRRRPVHCRKVIQFPTLVTGQTPHQQCSVISLD